MPWFVIAVALSGQVLDAATEKPVAGAQVRCESAGTVTRCASGQDGRFSCQPPAGACDLSISHPEYQTLAQAGAATSGALVVRLTPLVLAGSAVEIETTFEELRPSLLQQDPIRFSLHLQNAYAGKRVERLHRVCVGTDGSIASVQRLSPDESDLDAAIQAGIRTGWRYRPLPRPACYPWRLRIHFDAGRQNRRDLLPSDLNRIPSPTEPRG